MLKGSTITFTGAAGALSTQSVGAVTVPEGANVIGAVAGSQTIAELTVDSLTRSAGQGTINFVSTAPLAADPTGYGPLTGGRIKVTSAPTLVNGIIPRAVVVSNTDFASYGASSGVAAPGQNASVPGYSNQPLFVAVATQNVTVGGSPATNITGRTINSLRVTGANIHVPMASSSDLLTIGSGT